MKGSTELITRWSTIAAFSLVAAVGGGIATDADATTLGTARDACEQEVLQNYGAVSLERIKGHKANVYYVIYGYMDRGDGKERYFRCHVTYDGVDRVEIWHPYDQAWYLATPVTKEAEVQAPPEKTVAEPLDPAHPKNVAVGWGEPYSPAEGIKCYKKRGACFDVNGDLDISWTHKEFPG